MCSHRKTQQIPVSSRETKYPVGWTYFWVKNGQLMANQGGPVEPKNQLTTNQQYRPFSNITFFFLPFTTYIYCYCYYLLLYHSYSSVSWQLVNIVCSVSACLWIPSVVQHKRQELISLPYSQHLSPCASPLYIITTMIIYNIQHALSVYTSIY